MIKKSCLSIIDKQEHRIIIDDMTLKCFCGWRKVLYYRYQAADEAQKHYDIVLPDRLIFNRASKCLGNKVATLI